MEKRDWMTVLIIADDAEFSRDIVGRWHAERQVPAFTVVGSTVWQGADGGFDLAVLGTLAAGRIVPVLRMLENSSTAPVLCVTDEANLGQVVHEEFPRVLILRRHEGWLDAAVLLANEMLKRVEANERARRAEQTAGDLRRHATLGRYMLEMRHNLNNALTSVLGHSELLLLEPGALSTEVRDQIEVIRTMALRMHEVLQRLSSLDTEMQFAEKKSHSETPIRGLGSGVAG
jgi:signal transduction histidine kinase